MQPVQYVSVANIISDDLILSDGERRLGLLGGAGTYAAAGMRLWSDAVGIVSGVGEDFDALLGGWFRQNGIDTRGLDVRAPQTPHSTINYASDDDRVEDPQFGPEHFKRMEPTLADLPPVYHKARGLYLFRDANPAYWDLVYAFQATATRRPIIVWELHTGAADARQWDAAAAILARIDLVSLNIAEARALCGLAEPRDIVRKLLATGVSAVALRLGAEGTIAADQHVMWRIPIYPVEVMDVTGAGNAFTGGFLVGYCMSGGDVRRAGCWGAAAASFMLEQFGPPRCIDAALEHEARRRADRLEPIRLNQTTL
ncbi:MAG TPA: carbohydrate kinase family protein [Aggregatilinea sp.]|uniref:carbohydrate kinase family protein n=1 Tax=Aggregatilinea sp. TaxID=2806333 RepID=UPI002CFE4F26|nr:carbohydrate kinase family protein [Aggregatilinea sp.]HML21992.1 carbohydrate kinase family protein [Aggregatilinea sp.]